MMMRCMYLAISHILSLLLLLLFTDKHDSQSSVTRSMSTFTRPLQNALTASSKGNTAELNMHASIFITRTNRRMTLAA